MSQHPVTTEYGQAERQITETLMALHELQMPTVMLWPNVDAGSEDISRGMRKFREKLQAGVHPVLQEFPGRDLPAADAERRVPGRQLERVDSRGRVRRHARGQHRHPAGRPRARRRTSSTSATTARRSPRRSGARSSTARIPPAHLYGDGQRGRADCGRAGAHAAARAEADSGT